MELSLDRLTKHYGNKIAVDCVSATLKPGVYGLLGANGAGKTTLMRMLCAILESTSGEVLLNGKEVTLIESEDAINTTLILSLRLMHITSPF